MKKKVMIVVAALVLACVATWLVLANYGPDPGSGELISITLQAPAGAVLFYDHKQNHLWGTQWRYWKEWAAVMPSQSVQVDVPLRYSYERKGQRINYGRLGFGFYTVNHPHVYVTSIVYTRLGEPDKVYLLMPRWAGCGFLLIRETDAEMIVTMNTQDKVE